MAYISEIKSKDDPTGASDYIEVVLAPGEDPTDFDIVIYLRGGSLASTTPLETGSLVTLPDGTEIYTLSIQVWEGGSAAGPAGVALVSDPSTVEQFVAVGTTTVTASGGPANGMSATGVGNSALGESHYWEADGSYSGISTSTPGTICFAKGTYIDTKQGPRLVEDLAVGDRVLTRDNGYKRLTWIGKAHKTRLETARHESLQPVVIRKDAFELGCPSRDLYVSQQHRVLSSLAHNILLFGESETLVAARHMVNNTSIMSGGTCDVTYFHLMFDDHEIVRSNNAWTESFLPDKYALSTLSQSAQTEFDLLFPQFADDLGRAEYNSARYVVNKTEAKALLM